MAGITDILNSKTHSSLVWLLCINAAVFLFVAVGSLCVKMNLCSYNVGDMLMLPASAGGWLARPWTLLTYMFTHDNFIHLLVNMLWLLWFGVWLYPTVGSKGIVWLYIGGGLAGGLLYQLSSPLFAMSGFGGMLAGASASVFAIVAASAVLIPNERLHLFFIGDVRLIWVAVVMMVLGFIGLGGGNAGGGVAHLGGIVFGLAVGAILRHRARREAKPRRPQIKKRVISVIEQHRLDSERLDQLLDKIRVSGYQSLSRSERQDLDELSKKLGK